MKRIHTLISIVLSTVTLSFAQDCDLPLAYQGNTGSNMTVMLTSTFMSSLVTNDDNAYIVALNSEGLVVGSAQIGGMTQNSLAIWGDDTETQDVVDGAQEGEEISFQLIDDTDLYNVVMPTNVFYATNAMSIQIGTATTELVICSEDVYGCTDTAASNYNEEANVDDGSCEYLSVGVPIEYELAAGWNMVGYTGTAENNGIVAQMDAALGNGAGTANTFQVIKNVQGQFWSDIFAQVTNFNQGEGYMMYVIGEPTTVNFQQTSGYISGIEYELAAGWNMVAFTGDVNAENNIVVAMDAALGNGAGTANTFQVIKNVQGQFWSDIFAQINNFTPGEAYMMYVIGEPTIVNFQQE